MTQRKLRYSQVIHRASCSVPYWAGLIGDNDHGLSDGKIPPESVLASGWTETHEWVKSFILQRNLSRMDVIQVDIFYHPDGGSEKQAIATIKFDRSGVEVTTSIF